MLLFLFFENNGFSKSSEIEEVADLRQGSSFLTFFVFFLLHLEPYNFVLEESFGPPLFGGVAILGRSSGLF